MKRASELHASAASPKRRKMQKCPSPTALPEEMLVEIFSRMPAKSVGRFRCLSRSWAAMFLSSSFVDLHLQRANEGRRPPRLFFTTAQNRFHAWQHGGPLEQLTGALPDLPQAEPDCTVEVLTKPCHGLVLLHRASFHGHYVCNPCTGALSPLLDSKTPAKMRKRHNTYGDGDRVSYGLGYNSTTKKHKVVRLFSLYNKAGDAAASCEVFSLSTSVHWRPAAQQPPPSFTVRASAAAVFFNGDLHFLEHQGSCILTFSVCDEAFSSLLPPSGLENVPLELAVLDGRLCAHYGHPLRDDPYCIWRLGCHETAGQWERLCCIQRQDWPETQLPGPKWLSPLEIYRGVNGNKKIMFTTGMLTVFVVDLDGDGAPEIVFQPTMIGGDTTMKRFIESGAPRTVGLLEESLVSVGRGHEEVIFSSPSLKAWSDILKWMPAGSVAALRRVCKDWDALIQSHGFKQIHTLHANLGKSPRVMFIDHFGAFFALERLEREQRQMRAFLFPESPGFRVVCSKPCHGLVVGSCMWVGTSWDFLCNPVMGYYQIMSQTYYNEDGSFLAGRIGMGYDLRMKKHVRVLLVYTERNLDTRNYRLECYVQPMETNYAWRSIDPPPRPVADMQPAYAYGKLYWMVDPNLGTKSWRCEVLSLDVGTEEFEVLRGPPCNHKNITSIVELRGNICILCSDTNTNTIHVWTMEAAGVWSRGCQIDLGESFLEEYLSNETTVLAVNPNDERLLLSTGRALGYYDQKTKTIDTIYQLEERLHGMKFFPVLCPESLMDPCY